MFLGTGALCMIIPETVTDIIGILMVVIAISINILQAKKTKSALFTTLKRKEAQLIRLGFFY